MQLSCKKCKKLKIPRIKGGATLRMNIIIFHFHVRAHLPCVFFLIFLWPYDGHFPHKTALQSQTMTAKKRRAVPWKAVSHHGGLSGSAKRTGAERCHEARRPRQLHFVLVPTHIVITISKRENSGCRRRLLHTIQHSDHCQRLTIAGKLGRSPQNVFTTTPFLR